MINFVRLIKLAITIAVIQLQFPFLVTKTQFCLYTVIGRYAKSYYSK